MNRIIGRSEAELPSRDEDAGPVTFELVYPDFVGPAYPATKASIAAVLATMQAAANHPWNSVRVRFRFADAPPVVVSPRRNRA